MFEAKHLGWATACLLLAVPVSVSAQSSLRDQQDRCDRLRDDVETARRALDRQQALSEGQRQIDESATAYGRAKGHSQAAIEQAQRIRSMGRDWQGSESNARRQHQTATERYQLQGCSTGGFSNYNYDVD